MSTMASLKWQWAAAWSGVVFVVLYGVFWACFGLNLPPVSPSMSAVDLANHYVQHHSTIIFGQCMAATIAVLYAPWTAQMALTVARIEGASPVIALCVLFGGTLTTWIVIFCPAMWAAAAYRPNTDPAIIRAINDVTFISFNVTYMVITLQAVLVGIAGLMDKSANRVFPRWVSYWAIFTGLSFVPDTVTPMVTSGPMAWNGLVTYWLGLGTYFVWIISMAYCMAAEAKRRMALERNSGLGFVGSAQPKAV